MIDPILAWAMRYGSFLVHKNYMNIVTSLLNLINSWLREYSDDEKKVPKDLEDNLNSIALFSLIWAVGGALDETTRKNLHDVVMNLI